MTRSELVLLLKEQSPDLDSNDLELAIELFFNEISAGLTSGSRVELRGFGSFSVKNRSPRIARNPRTGEKVQIGSRLLPCFKAGKELNNLINS